MTTTDIEMFCRVVCENFSPLDTSYTKGELLCKKIGEEWVCKKMIKDPNYNGNRYIWEEEVQDNN